MLRTFVFKRLDSSSGARRFLYSCNTGSRISWPALPYGRLEDEFLNPIGIRHIRNFLTDEIYQVRARVRRDFAVKKCL